MAEKYEDDLIRGELNLLTDKLELKQKLPNGKPSPFILRLIISVLFLIWLSFITIPHLFELSRRKTPMRIAAERNVLFEDIIPSEKLEWHQCYDVFYCARLTVPMDYHRPLTDSKDNPKVHIALAMKPGRYSRSENYSISPLLVNPGGPGGSGVSFVLLAASLLQKVINPDQDIIGFDPRGIGATTPRADCFAYPFDASSSSSDSYTDEDYVGGNFHRLIWESSGLHIGNINLSTDSLLKWDSRARTMAKLCQEKDSLYGKDSILKYVNTPNVSRDMISIIDAWDEWRDSFSSQPSPCQKGKITEPGIKEETSALDREGKLVYWGFSYGTLLGATFAAMFPGRVGRVVLDGVVDADHYVAPLWKDSLLDADAIYNSFPTYCFEAAEKCALYRTSDRSASDIAERFESILTDIKNNPLTLVNHQTKTPAVISHSMIKSIIFTFLYAPIAAFPALALIANLLYYGQADILGQIFGMPSLQPVCSPSLPAYAFRNEAIYAIMCSDKRYPLNESLPVLEDRFAEMANISSFADVWMTLMLGCDAWSIKPVDPPMRWDDQPIHIPRPINTSFPILFVSNTYDPVTPLAAGLKMSLKFPTSGLIEQKSEGHCSIAAVSVCTIKKLRAYFRDGEVPRHPAMRAEREWERCEADEWPWHPFNGQVFEVADGVPVSGVEVEAIQAAKQLQEVFGMMKFFGLGRGDIVLSAANVAMAMSAMQ